MVRFVTALTFGFAIAGSVALLGAGPAAPMLPPQPATRPAGIPSDAMLVSPCVATMGEHWANLKNLPLGPIYGVWQGKPVFTEIMVSVEQLQKGFSYANVHALPGYTIDHVDVSFEPHGHARLSRSRTTISTRTTSRRRSRRRSVPTASPIRR